MQIQCAGVEESLTETLFTREVWGKGEFWPCSLFRWNIWDQGRGTDRRRRYGCQRQNDGQSRSEAGHKLGELL